MSEEYRPLTDKEKEAIEKVISENQEMVFEVESTNRFSVRVDDLEPSGNGLNIMIDGLPTFTIPWNEIKSISVMKEVWRKQ